MTSAAAELELSGKVSFPSRNTLRHPEKPNGTGYCETWQICSFFRTSAASCIILEWTNSCSIKRGNACAWAGIEQKDSFEDSESSSFLVTYRFIRASGLTVSLQEMFLHGG
jgi:hypothetical protein